MDDAELTALEQQFEDVNEDNLLIFNGYNLPSDNPLDFSFGETLRDLNTAAKLWIGYVTSEDGKEKVIAYIRETGRCDVMEICNLMLQIEDFHYDEYGIDEPYYNKEEKYSHSMAESNRFRDMLEESGVTRYFDFDAYGEDLAFENDVVLFDDGYWDGIECFNLERFDEDAVKEIADSVFTSQVKAQVEKFKATA